MNLPDVATVISGVITVALFLVTITSAIRKFSENTGWRRVTALRAAAKAAAEDLASEDLVVVAAAQAERRLILEKLTNKQLGTGPFWFAFGMGGALLILQSAVAATTSRTDWLFVIIALFAFVAGGVGAVVTTILRTSLLDLHSPPSVLLPKAQQRDAVRRQNRKKARAERKARDRAQKAKRKDVRKDREGNWFRRLRRRLHLARPTSEAPAPAPVPEPGAGAQGAAEQEMSASQETEAATQDHQ